MISLRRFVVGLVALAGIGRSPIAAQPGIRDSVFRFQSGALSLEGALTLPGIAGPWPAAVIIAGSGPTDRNGNSVAGVATDAYLLLARGLAEKGIASLRYDKRGLPSSRGAFDMAATTLGDFAADAAAAAQWLARRDDIRSVTFIGHSEGGMLAMLAARDGAPVAGLVLVGAVGRDPTTILREQIARQVPPDMLVQFDSAWAAYLRNDSTPPPPPGLQALFLPVNRRFVQSWQATDPVALLRGLPHPALVLQGETDLQITADDALALASARPDVQVRILPGVNHVLKPTSGATVQQQLPAYTDRSLPLAPAVVPAIVEFILSIR